MPGDRRVTLKSPAQIEKMAVAGGLVADVLDTHRRELRPGMTTAELDRMAEELIRGRGGIPSFIGVPGRVAPYRHSLCVSIDDEIVHGVPGSQRIRDGQIVSIDAGAIVDGWHGDGGAHVHRRRRAAPRRATWSRRPSGPCTPALPRPCPATTCRTSRRAIEDVAQEHGYGVIRAFVGHGIGTEMHEEPQVTNYRTGAKGRRIEPGLCLAIEPMFTLGHAQRPHPRRRLDSRHRGRRARGALGAHDRGARPTGRAS